MKNSKLSSKTLETEATIRFMMSELNTVNLFFPIVSVLTLLFYWFRYSQVNEISGANNHVGFSGLGIGFGIDVLSGLLLYGSILIWNLFGWTYLIWIYSTMKSLPENRRSSIIEVFKHLQPTIYLFVLCDLLLLFSIVRNILT